MPSDNARHVPSMSVLVDGSALDPKFANLVSEVVVQDNLAIPDTAQVTLVQPSKPHISGVSDPDDIMDSAVFDIGKELEVKAGGITDTAPQSIFKGLIVALEPEFSAGSTTLVLRAYDRSFWMTRATKTRTYQDQSAGDIIRKICNEHGLSVGTVDANSVTHKYVLQAAQSDWDFVQKIAREQNCEFVVDGRTAHFRSLTGTRTDSPALTLGKTLLSFSPRASAAMQPSKVVVRSWDVATSKALVGQSSSPPTVSSSIAFTSSKLGKLAEGMGSDGTVLIASRGSADQADAQALAEAVHGRMAEAGVEATGMALGEPRVKAGRMVEIKEVGTRFSGKYMVSSTTHIYRSSGYRTKFVISGHNSRTLSELLGGGGGSNGSSKPQFGGGLVVGIVTDRADPDNLGRVRVKFPQLVDANSADVEGWWARVVTMHAGDARGIVFMPEVDDEVVVAFEQGDLRRPYVIGSVFNGTGKPGAELYKSGDDDHNGSLLVETPKRFIVNAKDKVHMKTGKTYNLEVAEGWTSKIGKDSEHKISGAWITKADKTITIEAGGMSKIVIKAGGDLELSAGQGVKIKAGTSVDISGSSGVKVQGASVQIN
jgi:uncharacterized protein involved in type VI secretion and phage assembly